ncbi:right-handed parallel beta-helix repeat-containing protein [Flavivirga rizhaonensis]|uniref:Right handed beta helix domain-containing protein n=1 Tax=Flavivirga rizhaonensis TaxID=2559571 RepID=A0A4S1DUT3_9FLAO|nr:hypothetical protein [Flavivirga rizhaonensis]TGV01797.1 hypothetical protein EM932_14075 [Flavivirga rizhaonensis]
MKTKQLFLSATMLFAFICSAQTTITVDNSIGSNAEYSDLQSAISAANSGDVIYVHASVINYGIITVNTPLTIIGFGHSDSDKETMVNDLILGANASNTTISGLHITDDLYTSGNTGISNVVIENNIIDGSLLFNNGGVDNVIIRGNIIYEIGNTSSHANNNNYTNAIISNNIITYYIGLKNHQSITIKNNVFLSPYFGYPVYNADDDTGSITLQNNIFYYNTSSTYDPNSDGIIFENCLTYNIGSGNVTALNGTNNLNNQNPNFVSATDDIFNPNSDDYHLQGGSPAIGSGAGGIDLGIYDGSTFIFNNFGYTNGIPTVKITNITDRIAPGANLSVTISTNAN